MRKILLFLAVISFTTLTAQETFQSSVKIEFEKTVYSKQLYMELYKEWYDQFKQMIPEQVISYYEFTGNTEKSIYKETKEAVLNPRSWYQAIADKNVVYNDYKAGKTITQKPVFEETFLVEDSLLKIKWKLTSDTRNIAGYDCRKALGFIDDTVAVFAFYTDEILITGGPESIQGLPGMILGVGVPRLHITWFATKVEVNGVNVNNVIPASKGKKVDRKKMMTALDDALKTWGKHGRNMILNFVI